MTSKDETSLQIIASQKAWYRLVNAVFVGFSALIGTIVFISVIFVPPPPTGDNLYNIPWGFITLFVLLALLRNRILHFVFRKIPHSYFLSLVHYGRISNYILLLSGFFSLIIGIGMNNAQLTLFSFGTFFMWLPIFSIFSEPLTYAGEIRLLFESLLTNIDNFEKRQPYLKTISKKVESQLRMGNIKVPQNEFVYYFNMMLFKGTDIKNDLKNIEAWMVDKKTPCFESLGKIYPENKLEPWKRISLSRQLVETPTIIKYILYVVALILIAISPALQNEILKLLSRLLGI